MQERPGIPFIGRLRPRRACPGCRRGAGITAVTGPAVARGSIRIRQAGPGRSEREGDAGCGIAGAERRWRVGPAVRAGDARGGRAAPIGGPGLSASRGGEGERGWGLLRDGPVLAREQAVCGEVGRGEGRRWAAVSHGLGWGKERLGWFGLD